MADPQIVILYGDPQDNTLTLPLCRALAALGGVLYCGGGHVAVYSGSDAAERRFVLIETDALRSCGTDNTFVICKPGAVFPDNLLWPGRLYALAQEPPRSPVPDALEWLGCACGTESTFALSSLREDSAVVELRRTIVLPNGDALEPGEFPLRLNAPMEGWPLMVCCVLRLLFGGA